MYNSIADGIAKLIFEFTKILLFITILFCSAITSLNLDFYKQACKLGFSMLVLL